MFQLRTRNFRLHIFEPLVRLVLIDDWLSFRSTVVVEEDSVGVAGEHARACDVEVTLLPIDEAKRWALFLCHRRALVRFAQKLVKNADDAEDLVQDLGLLVIGHATGPRDDANFCAWCRGLIRNIAVHHWRSKARRFDQASPVGFEIIEYPEDEHQANPEDKAHVRKRLDVLSMLDDRALELLRRRYVLGETSGEIARSLQRSPDSIRMQLMRLRASLRDAAPADEPSFAEETTTAG